MKRRLLALAALSLLLVACRAESEPPASAVEINGQRLTVEVARTDDERRRGLSDRPTLPADAGMLFIFSEPKVANFWMNGMRFPLDFIWIADQAVVGITADVPVPTSSVLTLYTPSRPISYVLEVNAGWAATHKIMVGDTVKLLLQ